MAVYNVIDVSNWQGKIDWKKVKASGITGAVIRYADGTDVDSRFEENMKNAKSAGLHIGAYTYSRAKNKAQAEDEAKRLYNACKKYNPDLPLYIDLEAKGLEKYADTVAPAFLNKMKALGGRGGVYANLHWWNNYLTKTAKNYSASPFWIAQYNDRITHKNPSLFGMWQYTSKGSVDGIKGRVDRDRLYIEYWKTAPKPSKQGYTGKFPTYRLTKTNAQVIADTIAWAKWIAKDNDFHYGYGEHAHHNGCYFCGTQRLKKGHGIKMWEHTYCCNAFVGASWAHGGGDATAWKLCHDCDSWGFSKNDSPSYEKSSLFDKVSLNSLKPGDVLCADYHVALYIGNGKVIQASGGDDNVIKSSKWNKSISEGTWNDYKRAYRYNGKVNVNRPLSEGEVSDRVLDLKKFLIWYGFKLDANKIFSANTTKAVIIFQEKEMGKAQADGIVGEATIAKMKAVKK